MTITRLTRLFTPIISNERVRNKPMAYDHDIMTVKEICDLLQVNQSTVYKLIRLGKIPSFRIGADWRFRSDVIKRWMVEQSMGAQQARPKR
jgi:excisionase family DNA binding protein